MLISYIGMRISKYLTMFFLAWVQVVSQGNSWSRFLQEGLWL